MSQENGPPPPVPESSRPGSQVSGSPKPESNPNAPRFFNISNNETVHERVFLLHGGAGPEGRQYEASVVVYHHLNCFPAQRFPVVDGFFKAMVYLEPGQNQLRFSFESAGSAPIDSRLTLNYVPLTQNPPLHLALILGKDSKGEFDSPDYKKRVEGNSLDVAIKKLRMTGYMMSAFTSEQMYRNGFGHRTFRLYEEWTNETLSNRDSIPRSTAKVHIVRSEKTVAEIRDPNIAQQNKNATDKGKLFGIALDALRDHGGVFTESGEVHVACVFVDAHWDPVQKLIQGHAALGGGYSNIRLGIFGGHALYSWPKCIEDIVPCFLDDTTTDTRQVANDSDQSGTAWENCNIGQGAFMHEVGHALSLPHRTEGIMLRGYITWNRSFMIREAPHCARTGKPGMRLTLPKDECGWHRLDTVVFRYHPLFRFPHEYPSPLNSSKPNLYPVRDGAVAKADSGIYLIEIHADGNCRAHIEFVDNLQREVWLTEDDLRRRLPGKYQQDRNKEIKIEVLSLGLEKTEVPNFRQLMAQGRQNSSSGPVYRSSKLGGGSGDEQVVEFPQRGIPVTCVRVHSGRAVDGVEFFFGDGSSKLFGKRGGSPHDFPFQQGEVLLGLFCRTGAWVDGVQVVTNMRRSDVYGNTKGGSGHNMVVPRGYSMRGIYGNVGAWVISIGIIYGE